MRGISAGDMRQMAHAAHLVSLKRLVVENFSAIERIAFEWCAATEQWHAVVHYHNTQHVDHVFDIVPASVRAMVQEIAA